MDAISFVLAISTKYLRSQNLHELVYHNDETDLSAETCSIWPNDTCELFKGANNMTTLIGLEIF